MTKRKQRKYRQLATNKLDVAALRIAAALRLLDWDNERVRVIDAALALANMGEYCATERHRVKMT